MRKIPFPGQDSEGNFAEKWRRIFAGHDSGISQIDRQTTRYIDRQTDRQKIDNTLKLYPNI